METENGYIKLWRKFEKWEWFDSSNMVHLFIFLLMRATHEDCKYHGYDIKRGQVIFGLKATKKATGISVQSLRTCLTKLKSTHEITYQPTHDFSIVTICNYESYQSNPNKINTPINTITNIQSTSHQQPINNIQEDKEHKNKDIVTKNIPDSIQTVIAFIGDSNLGTDFWDYYQSKGWVVGKSPMKDWRAAARRWIRMNKQNKPMDRKHNVIDIQ